MDGRASRNRRKTYVLLVLGAVGDEQKARELQDVTKARTAPYKYPRAVEFAELPETPTGKLQRFRLRQIAAGGDSPQA